MVKTLSEAFVRSDTVGINLKGIFLNKQKRLESSWFTKEDGKDRPLWGQVQSINLDAIFSKNRSYYLSHFGTFDTTKGLFGLVVWFSTQNYSNFLAEFCKNSKAICFHEEGNCQNLSADKISSKKSNISVRKSRWQPNFLQFWKTIIFVWF